MALRGLASAVVVLGLATAGGRAAESAVWPDDFVGRLETLALIETLNAELLSHDSATLTLERWCADHRLADPARIVAERVHDVEKPATAGVRAALDVKPDEPLGYRRVRLKCGDRVLSEADNWYVPSRLTPEMKSCARDDRHAVRQGGRGAPLPAAHPVGGALMVAAAEGMGDGRGRVGARGWRARRA